ncbi:lipid kinase YegS [Streptomyces avermitilis]
MVVGRALTVLPGGVVRAVVRVGVLGPGGYVVVWGPDDDFAALLAGAAGRAARRGGALGVCGGDGSVDAAARAAARHGLALAVFPGGTLNHFALDVGVPDFDDTAVAVARGEAVAVDLGVAAPKEGHDVLFLNAFSIGPYPELLRLRERLEGRWGKWSAEAVALARVLRTATPVELRIDGRPRRLWLLFAGNGHHVPDGFAPAFRPRLDDGLLDLRLIDGDRRYARTRVIAAALAGTLGRSRVYSAAPVSRVRLEGLGGTRNLAYDGEVTCAPDQLTLEKRGRGLAVYRPAVPCAEPARRARLATAMAHHRKRKRGRRLPADGGPSV